MKRLALTLSSALLAGSVLAGGAAGTHSEGAGPKKDLVAGTGTFVVPQPFLQAPQVHVNASRHPDTDEPRGHFYIRYANPDIDLAGPVVCVDAAANTGTVIGMVERARGAPSSLPQEGEFLRIRITDNGEPGTLDLGNWDPLPGVTQPPTSCPAQPGDLPVSQGNYIVHDGVVPLSLLPALDLLLGDLEAAAGEH